MNRRCLFIDINPFGIFDISRAFHMCYTLDMPCGARGLYIISNLQSGKYIDFTIR